MNYLTTFLVWSFVAVAVPFTVLTACFAYAGEYRQVAILLIPSSLLWWAAYKLSNIQIGRQIKHWIKQFRPKGKESSSAQDK